MSPILFVTFLATMVCGSTIPQQLTQSSQLQERQTLQTYDGLDITISDIPNNDEKRETTWDGLDIFIGDDNGNDKRNTQEDDGHLVDTRAPIQKDYISHCGKNWIPVFDTESGWIIKTYWWGYESAVDAFCSSVSKDRNGNPFIIAPGKMLSATRGWQNEKDKTGRQVALKNDVKGHIEFEIHNRQTVYHTPNEADCKKYLKKMMATDAKCYGSTNRDTRGGTWAVGDTQITYHALPAPGVTN